MSDKNTLSDTHNSVADQDVTKGKMCTSNVGLYPQSQEAEEFIKNASETKSESSFKGNLYPASPLNYD